MDRAAVTESDISNSLTWTSISEGIDISTDLSNYSNENGADFETTFAAQQADEIFLAPPQIAQIPTSHGGKTALHIAAENGHQSSVWLLLDRLPDIHAQDDRGRTALHLAIDKKRASVVQALLARRTDTSVDVQDSDGLTALHLACRDGQESLVDLLMKANAQLEIRNREGQTALHLAVQGGYNEVIQILLNNRADINARIG